MLKGLTPAVAVAVAVTVGDAVVGVGEVVNESVPVGIDSVTPVGIESVPVALEDVPVDVGVAVTETVTPLLTEAVTSAFVLKKPIADKRSLRENLVPSPKFSRI